MAKNYRPMSELSGIVKIFERISQNQSLAYMDKFLWHFICRYRNSFSSQAALLCLVDKWKATLDKKYFAGGILMDLSKPFDNINQELLIAKLHAYGLDKSWLELLWIYLTNCWQKTAFSSWSKIIKGLPQGSDLFFSTYS